MKLLFVNIVVLFAFIGFVLCESDPSPPEWPASYTITGVLRLPYAELVEPFKAYYDQKNKSSRIGFYNDTVVTYLKGNVGTYGTSFKVAYMTDKTHYNKRSCFQTNGTSANDTISAQSVLPDLTGFKLKNSSMLLDGVNVSMWYKDVDHKTGKISKYTFYYNINKKQPHRYVMFGYDSLLGSHFDKYYVDYLSYNTTDVPADMFVVDVPKNTTCTGFPGPGNAERRNFFNPMREYINHDDSHHQEMFARFKATHNKKYADKAEHAEREAVFRQNVRFIHSKNRSPITYSLGVNHLADRTRDELKLMNGRIPSKGYNGGLPFDKSLYADTPLPGELDWRLFGAVNPVKDQAVCGSCWSFGTTGTIEGAYFLATGKLLRFSQQELMDCSWGYGNNACDGGEDFRAYDWIVANEKNGGLATEDDYGPYRAVDSKCRSRSVTGTVKIKGFTNVTNDAESLKFALYNHGPVSVGIDASHLSLSFYANGVYYEEKCGNDPDSLDHAVLAVGYGVMNGQEYWLIKNSWSTYWGNDGYVLMSQLNNNCGVTTSATFVTVKT